MSGLALFKDGQQNCHVNVTITNVSMIVAKCQLVLLHTYMIDKKIKVIQSVSAITEDINYLESV